MAKFAINASGAMLLPSLVQVSESISGSVALKVKFSWPQLVRMCESGIPGLEIRVRRAAESKVGRMGWDKQGKWPEKQLAGTRDSSCSWKVQRGWPRVRRNSSQVLEGLWRGESNKYKWLPVLQIWAAHLLLRLRRRRHQVSVLTRQSTSYS